MRIVKLVVLASLALLLGEQTSLAGALGPQREAFKEALKERMKERQQQVAAMRQAVHDFFEAKASGDRTAAMAAAKKASEIWQSLPARLQQKIEENHPGVADRIKTLPEEFDLPDEPAAARSWQPRYADDLDIFGGRPRPHHGGAGRARR